jgi:hypothetical protein
VASFCTGQPSGLPSNLFPQPLYFLNQARNILAGVRDEILICSGRPGELDVIAAILPFPDPDKIRPAFMITPLDERFPGAWSRGCASAFDFKQLSRG